MQKKEVVIKNFQFEKINDARMELKDNFENLTISFVDNNIIL